MTFIFDNLVASLVGMVAMLMLVTVMTRNTQSNVQASKYYAARVQGNALVEMIKGDLSNIGAGVTDRSDMLEAPEASDDGARTESFAFRADIDDQSPGAEHVRYTLQEVDGGCTAGTDVDGSDTGTIACWELVREEEEGANWVVAGKSPPSITEFTLTLYDASGNATADAAAAREVGVELVLLSPLGQEGIVQKSRWSSRFRPMNLSIE